MEPLQRANLYLCEDEDYQRIYTCDPANGKIKQVAASEDIIMSYALADNAPVLFYYGQSASNANRLYAYDLKVERTAGV